MGKWNEHIIAEMTEEMKKALPKGLRYKNGMIKEPDSPHPLHDKFYAWCVKFHLGSGFSL